MFTGIVQAVGRVGSVADGHFTVAVPDGWPEEPWIIGESISINGCCLTLVESGGLLHFDLSEETLARATLGSLQHDTKINIERAMKASDRIGGHIVQGHVDTVGKFISMSGTQVASFVVEPEFANLLIHKGSVAIDGVSLTVIEPEGGKFRVALIPHTLKVTNFGRLRPGQAVNVEFDVLGKYALNLR